MGIMPEDRQRRWSELVRRYGLSGQTPREMTPENRTAEPSRSERKQSHAVPRPPKPKKQS